LIARCNRVVPFGGGNELLPEHVLGTLGLTLGIFGGDRQARDSSRAPP
jgi:hypothetical protein